MTRINLLPPSYSQNSSKILPLALAIVGLAAGGVGGCALGRSGYVPADQLTQEKAVTEDLATRVKQLQRQLAQQKGPDATAAKPNPGVSVTPLPLVPPNGQTDQTPTQNLLDQQNRFIQSGVGAMQRFTHDLGHVYDKNGLSGNNLGESKK